MPRRTGASSPSTDSRALAKEWAAIGALAAHLAGDLASFITGQTVCVDGGETL